MLKDNDLEVWSLISMLALGQWFGEMICIMDVQTFEETNRALEWIAFAMVPHTYLAELL
jgi:hypothetical protein